MVVIILNQVMENFLCHSKLIGFSTHIVFPGNTSNSYPLYLPTFTWKCNYFLKQKYALSYVHKKVCLSWWPLQSCFMVTVRNIHPYFWERKFIMEIFSSERHRIWDIQFFKCTSNSFYVCREHIFLINNIQCRDVWKMRNQS